MILPKDALPVEYCVVFSSSWLLPVWRAREHKGGSRLKPQSSFQIVSAHLQQRHCRASQHTRALDTAERHSTRGRQTPQSVTAHEGAMAPTAVSCSRRETCRRSADPTRTAPRQEHSATICREFWVPPLGEERCATGAGTERPGVMLYILQHRTESTRIP